MLKEHLISVVIKTPTDFESQEFEVYREALALLTPFIVKMIPLEEKDKKFLSDGTD